MTSKTGSNANIAAVHYPSCPHLCCVIIPTNVVVSSLIASHLSPLKHENYLSTPKPKAIHGTVDAIHHSTVLMGPLFVICSSRATFGIQPSPRSLISNVIKITLHSQLKVLTFATPSTPQRRSNSHGLPITESLSLFNPSQCIPTPTRIAFLTLLPTPAESWSLFTALFYP